MKRIPLTSYDPRQPVRGCPQREDEDEMSEQTERQLENERKTDAS